jgi:endonuclease/exonuclease/phosphatase family metal-dependent hydrolase
MHLRVVTFNVWNTEGDPRRSKLINRELRRLDPDLVSLQEVVQTPEHDQLAELLDGTGLHGTHQNEVLADVPPGGDGYGGCALATRSPHRIVEVIAAASTTCWSAPGTRTPARAAGSRRRRWRSTSRPTACGSAITSASSSTSTSQTPDHARLGPADPEIA